MHTTNITCNYGGTLKYYIFYEGDSNRFFDMYALKLDINYAL